MRGKRQQRAKTGCDVGRDSYDPANVVCISCRKQAVPCPWVSPGGENALQKSNLEADPPEVKQKEAKGPNKTEAAYGRMLELEFPGCEVVYEPLTIRLKNGHGYTPDWFVFQEGKVLLVVEVKARGKNGFRHGSYQRAKLAFDQSKIEYPHWRFRWAEKCGMSWDVIE